MTLLHNTTTIMDAMRGSNWMQRAAAMRAYEGFIDMLTRRSPGRIKSITGMGGTPTCRRIEIR
jgi:hypothetical protein